MNQVGNTEIINIYEGKPEPKECCHQHAPAPREEAAPAPAKKKK